MRRRNPSARATFTKIESPTLPKSHPLHTVYAARVGNTEFRIARDGKGWCVDLYEPIMGIWERASETYPTLAAAKAAFKHETSKLRRNPAQKATASARLIAKLEVLTEDNDHTGALLTLAKAVEAAALKLSGNVPGDVADLTRTIDAICAARDRKGYMDEALSKRSYAAYKKLMAKVKRYFTSDSVDEIYASL